MTTLESRYLERVGEFRARVTGLQQLIAETADDTVRETLKTELAGVEAEEVEYMLCTAPFIDEYTSERRTEAPSLPSTNTGGALDNFVTITHKNDRNSVFQKYLLLVEGVTGDMSLCLEVVGAGQEYMCTNGECKGAAMVDDARQSMLVCPLCSCVRPYVGNTEANLSYQEEISQHTVSNFSYKRFSHFTELLNSIQARETTEISPDIIEAIRTEFKKNRTSQRKDITPAKVRQYMKKLNLNKLYEHAHYVCTLINGIPAPRLDPELESTLKRMFLAIQEPFERAIKGTSRKNFLSYSYTFFKFLQLLGRDDLLCHFSLLKSSEKLYQQDRIWASICQQMGWEFVASV